MAENFLAVQTQTPWGRNLALFADWIAPQPGWITLDVGCGPGLLPLILSQRGCRAFGVDLDPQMFRPTPLHPQAAAADALALPFPARRFDLVTASNLLFLLPEPGIALRQMARLLRPAGQIALLNPSERLSLAAAVAAADAHRLQGVARESLLTWARRAEANRRWTETNLAQLLASEGLHLIETSLKIGPGFASFVRGRLKS
jgi:ubiquinone/menaquinone biosynthesis C-methylase UbiE